MKYTLELAVSIITEIEPKFASVGCHLGLTGSCLYRDRSDKDIDIIVFPHKDDEQLPEDELCVFIRGLGFELKDPNFNYPKRVWVSYFREHRIDLFIL